jgi:phytoene synthase
MELNDHIFAPSPFSAISKKLGIASAEDYAYCRQIMQNASRRYSFASRFLPAEKLKHVEALYAFLRIGDDRVDVSFEGFETPLSAIEDWEKTYWRAFEFGDSPDPVMRAYLNTAIECDIPREMMTAYFRAMKEDLTITRFLTFSDLLHYMDGSAVPVGRAMTYILGVREPYTLKEAIPHADCLSIAMQLSNFLRDVGNDWEIGRIYLPLEDMAQFQVTEKDLAEKRIDQRFKDLMEFEIDRSINFYDLAYDGVNMLATGRFGVMSGLEIYRGILTDIHRIGYDVFNRRADPSTSQKLLMVVKSWLATY